MLSGSLPFCEADTATLYKKILSGSYKFPNFISSSAKNLIESILVINPSKRSSIEAIRNHEWFNLLP
jgi:serine/threonine protein kinase